LNIRRLAGVGVICEILLGRRNRLGLQRRQTWKAILSLLEPPSRIGTIV
jgi:hypothetical protein